MPAASPITATRITHPTSTILARAVAGKIESSDVPDTLTGIGCRFAATGQPSEHRVERAFTAPLLVFARRSGGGAGRTVPVQSAFAIRAAQKPATRRRRGPHWRRGWWLYRWRRGRRHLRWRIWRLNNGWWRCRLHDRFLVLRAPRPGPAPGAQRKGSRRRRLWRGLNRGRHYGGRLPGRQSRLRGRRR